MGWDMFKRNKNDKKKVQGKLNYKIYEFLSSRYIRRSIALAIFIRCVIFFWFVPFFRPTEK